MVADALYTWEKRPEIVGRVPGQTAIERIAHRLNKLADTHELVAIKAWARVVKGRAQEYQSATTVRAYGQLLRVFDHHAAFNAREIAAAYDELIAEYHAEGKSAVDVHDEVAVMIAGWRK